MAKSWEQPEKMDSQAHHDGQDSFKISLTGSSDPGQLFLRGFLLGEGEHQAEETLCAKNNSHIYSIWLLWRIDNTVWKA